MLCLDRGRFSLVAALLVALVAVACGGGDAAAPRPQEEIAATPEVRTYSVRGVVRKVMESGVFVQHEAIDDFVAVDGMVTGMDSMVMPFSFAEGVSRGELAEGDVIRFELRVDWRSDLPAVITGYEKLPPGTELEFRAAEPPGGATS